MYCPACSAHISDNQKYCRSCGLDIQPIIPFVIDKARTVGLNSRLRNILKKIEYVGMAMGGSGLALMIGTAIFALLALSFIGPDAKSMSAMWSQLFGVGLVLLLKGAFLFTAPWVIKEFWPKPSFQSSAKDEAKTVELLAELNAEPVFSVAEETTRNLEPAFQDRARQNQ